MTQAASPIPNRATPAIPSYSPGMTPLVLGSVIFNSSECPEDFPIGGLKQMNVVHTLPGGSRIINRFGPSPDPVQWKGRLWSFNVRTRIDQLRLYAVSGNTILLAWKDEQYNVVVSSFVPHYHNEWQAEYEIEVLVESDANGAFTITNPLTVDQQVQGLQQLALDQNNVIVQADPTGSADIQQQLPVLQSTISAAGPLASADPSHVAAVNAQLNTVISSVVTYLATLPATAGHLPAATLLLSALENIGTNINRGQQPNAQIAQGGSLFAIAAQHYGDPTQAFTLAAFNGLVSPWLSATRQTTIKLPPLTGLNLQ